MAIIKTKPLSEFPTDQIESQSYQTIGDIYTRAQDLGITTNPFDIESLLKRLQFTVCREEMDVDISGYIENRSGKWFIGLNQYQNPKRQRFTMAHEFAHFLFDAEQIGQTKRTDTILFRANDRDAVEVRANDFAGKLLIPKNQLDAYIADGIKSIQDLADKFNVTPAALKYRAFRLGYVKSY